MSTANKLALLSILVSLGFLYPGLTLDVLTIEIAPTLPIVGKVELFSETRSILGTISNLFDQNNTLVALLILLFSVLIPIIKAIMLLTALFSPNKLLNFKLFTFVRSIGKWSMADVFIVGVFVAYLSTGSMKGIDAFIEQGFYYFAAYCFLSVLTTQLINIDKPQAND
jgi:uncharacterized paraquat-inducible protein A